MTRPVSFICLCLSMHCNQNHAIGSPNRNRRPVQPARVFFFCPLSPCKCFLALSTKINQLTPPQQKQKKYNKKTPIRGSIPCPLSRPIIVDSLPPSQSHPEALLTPPLQRSWRLRPLGSGSGRRPLGGGRGVVLLAAGAAPAWVDGAVDEVQVLGRGLLGGEEMRRDETRGG